MTPNTRTSFLSSKPVRQTINEVEVDFFPISIALAGEFRGTIQSLATALTTLFNRREAFRMDMGVQQRTIANDKGSFDSETVTTATTPELAALRHNQCVEAIGRLVSGLTSKETMELLARLCMDSMRTIYPRGSNGNPSPAEFLEQTDLPIMFELLKGVLAANKGVFGPFADSFQTAIDLAAKRINEALKEQKQDQSQNPTAG